MLVFLMKQIFQKRLFKISFTNIAIYIFTAAALLSGIGSPYYRVSLLKVFYYFVTGTLLYYLVISADLGINKISKLISGMLIVTFLTAAYGILTFITKRDFLFGKIYSQNVFFPQALHFNMGRILSSLGHPDFFGSYLAILSPLFLFNICYCKTRFKKLMAWSSYLTVASAILLTFSGGAYLAFIVANFVLVFIVKKEKFECINKLPLVFLLCPGIVLTMAFLVVVSVVILNNQNINSVIFKILDRLFLGKIGFQEMLNLGPLVTRIDSLRIAWSIIKTNPINGIGVGNISTGKYVLNKVAMDNMYLSIGSESGVLGLSSFLFLNFAIFKKGLISCKNIVVEKHRFILLTLFMCMISFLIDSFYWDTYYHPTIRIIYWLIIALSASVIKNLE